MMEDKFLSRSMHMIKDYELKKLLWQAGGALSLQKDI